MPPPRCLAWAAFAMVAAVLLSGCQDDTVKVLSLDFSGNKAVSSSDLRSVLATQSSGWLPWSRKHYFNRAEFESDLSRIVHAYADRGYPHAKVTDAKLTFNKSHDGVHINLAVEEGQPLIVDDIEMIGFDGLPPAGQAMLTTLPLKAGEPRDRHLALAARDLAQRAWRDQGFPAAAVVLGERPASTQDHVVVTLSATPGPRALFGEVSVVGNKNVDPSVVSRTITFRPGQWYSERAVVESQRRLQSLSVFRLANIDTRSAGLTEADRVPVTVTVREAPSQRLTLRAGYGSEEKVRVGAEWSHLNLFGRAEMVSAAGKWSALERTARASFGEPAFAFHTSLDLTGEFSSSDEPGFLSRNSGGRLTLNRRYGTQSDLRGTWGGDVKVILTHEYLSYQIKSASLGDPTLRSQFIALGLNPDTGAGAGTLASIAVDVSRHTTDRAVDPSRGTLLEGKIEHATPSLGGTYRYDEFSAEARHYVSFGDARRWAIRARAGTLLAATDADVPYSGRYFLGGSTTLRGWGRFEVSPLSELGEPVGGRSRLELSSEWEVRLTPKLSVVAFVDAGNVWIGDWDFHLNDLRYDVGPGLRYKTPVGALRLDIGYQLNPITGLFVNGQPSIRRWRIHFGIGEAF